jgi:hypothetical protein
MLKITDLPTSKAMDSKTMSGVHGGTTDLERLGAMLDFSSSISNQVADIQQAFGFGIAQSNVGTVTNNQSIIAGNGVVFAPVRQTQTQSNNLSIADIGNALVGGGFPI